MIATFQLDVQLQSNIAHVLVKLIALFVPNLGQKHRDGWYTLENVADAFDSRINPVVVSREDDKQKRRLRFELQHRVFDVSVNDLQRVLPAGVIGRWRQWRSNDRCEGTEPHSILGASRLKILGEDFGDIAQVRVWRGAVSNNENAPPSDLCRLDERCLR